MRKLLLSSLLFLAVLPAPAHPQVGFQMQINLGTPLPPQPPLVAVQPGVQVVEDWNEEVFFTGGYYWVRRDDRWYRAPQPRAAFVYVEPRYVPAAIVRMPPGQYVRYDRHRANAERKEWKEREKEERRAWKEHGKAERKEWKENDDDQGGHGGGKHKGHGHD